VKRFGQERSFELLKKCGFDACDFSFYNDGARLLGDDYMENAAKTKEMLDKAGLLCNQAHAPFGSPYAKYSVESIPHFPRMFECCAELGIETVVIHPIQDGPFKEKSEELLLRSVEFYKGLVPIAREYGVKMATENM
jgi:sugar phosphate isomerase/epimerase